MPINLHERARPVAVLRANVLSLPSLCDFSPAFIALINRRGKQMRHDEKRMCEHGRYHHFNLRTFKLDALNIAFDEMDEAETEAFCAYWNQ